MKRSLGSLGGGFYLVVALIVIVGMGVFCGSIDEAEKGKKPTVDGKVERTKAFMEVHGTNGLSFAQKLFLNNSKMTSSSLPDIYSVLSAKEFLPGLFDVLAVPNSKMGNMAIYQAICLGVVSPGAEVTLIKVDVRNSVDDNSYHVYLAKPRNSKAE